MSQRQEGHHNIGAVGFLIAQLQQSGADVGDNVLVAEHDPLRIARRPRCVADGAQITWLRWLFQRPKQSRLIQLILRRLLGNNYEGSVLLFGAEFLDLFEAEEADASILSHSRRARGDGFDVDQLFEARRGVVQYRFAFFVRLANHRRHRRYRETRKNSVKFNSIELVWWICTLVDDVFASFGSQSVVERDNHHRIAVECVFGEDPFGAVLTVDAHQSVGSGLETQCHQTRAQVLGAQQRLFVPHPTVRFVGTFPPSQAWAVICSIDLLFSIGLGNWWCMKDVVT